MNVVRSSVNRSIKNSFYLLIVDNFVGQTLNYFYYWFTGNNGFRFSAQYISTT